MKTKTVLLAAIITGSNLVFSLFAKTDLVLRYDQPALSWEREALPIGNGQMGAMLFGGIQREQIQFNEESLWIGDEEDTGAYQAFGDVFVEFSNVKPTNVGIAAPATIDGNSDTKWCEENKGVFPMIWAVRLSADDRKSTITRYTLTSANDVPERDPSAWRFYGSQDAKTWTLLDERKDVAIWPARNSAQSFEFKNQTAYSHYKFEFLGNHGASHFQLAEIGLGALKLASTDQTALPVPGYRRELDLERAVHTVTFDQNGIKSLRRVNLANAKLSKNGAAELRHARFGDEAITVICPAPVIKLSDKSSWTIVKVSSQETSYNLGAYPARQAIDGKPETLWTTRYAGGHNDPPPHELILDLGDSTIFHGLKLLARQDGNPNGISAKIEVFVSDDPKVFKDAVIVAEPWKGAPDAKAWLPLRDVRFPQIATGRYLRLVFSADIRGNPWATLAELDLIQE